MSAQFIRKCSLIVYGQGSIGQSPPSSPGALGPDGTPLIEVSPAPALPGMELGQFRIQFRVAAMDVDAPPTAIIRVLNLASSTVQQIQQEFQNVVLQAGYEGGNFGVIFQGSIIRTRVGRLNNIETFLDIMASNFDAVYNYGVVSRTLAAGADAPPEPHPVNPKRPNRSADLAMQQTPQPTAPRPLPYADRILLKPDDE